MILKRIFNFYSMRLKTIIRLALILVIITSVVACKSKSNKEKQQEDGKKAELPGVFKGLYSLGPDIKSFKDCATGKAYWVADSTAQLELKYWQLVTSENKDQPVYIEAEGEIVPSNKDDADDAYANTLVVHKLITITKDIPAGICN